MKKAALVTFVIAGLIGLYAILGDNLSSFIGEIVAIVVMSVLGFFTLVYAFSRLRLSNQVHAALGLASTLVVVSWVVSDVYASVKLAPIKSQFYVAAGTPDLNQIRLVDGDDEQRVLDYHGTLTPILQKRNTILERIGFVPLGSWWVSTSGTNTGSLYVFVGKRLASKCLSPGAT